MLFKTSLLLVLVLSVLICAYPQSQLKKVEGTSCGLNEIPTDCLKPCLPTCDRPKRPKCSSHICTKGCVCKEGHIREKDDGKCVPISSCVDPGEISLNYTEPCGDNEIYGGCTNCPLICHGGHMVQCSILYCVHGCVCKEGYARNEENGPCITEQECEEKKLIRLEIKQ